MYSTHRMFRAHKYPFAPYGFAPVINIKGTPANELANLDKMCAMKFEAMDSINSQYKLTITGTFESQLLFQNNAASAGFPATNLTYINQAQGTRFDLVISYLWGTLTFIPNNDQNKAFMVYLA